MGRKFSGFSHIDRQILKLSLPAIASNVTVPLLGICDTAISGHLGSELYLASIAVGSVMMNVIFWILGFLRTGTTGLTAVSLGATDGEETKRIFTLATIIAFIAGVFFILISVPLFNLLWNLTGGEEEIKEMVGNYFYIRIWGVPAMLVSMAVTGWFVGMQNTVYPLIISIGMNIINIILSFILAIPMGWGLDGVACGTMFSNWFGMLLSLGCVIFFIKGKNIFSNPATVFKKKILIKFFSVNINLFIRSLCIIAVTMGVTSAGAMQGTLVLSVNIIVMQFFQFFSFFMDGFAFSGEALVGLNWGKRDLVKLRKSVKALLRWTLSMAIIFSLAYSIFTVRITSLLTDSLLVREGIKSVAVFIWLIPLVSAWAFIYDGFYVGITDTFLMMISTLTASVLFFIIVFGYGDRFIQLTSLDGNKIIWIAFLIYLGVRGIVLAIAWQGKKSLSSAI